MTTRRLPPCETFAALIMVMMISIVRGSYVQVFHLAPNNGDSAFLALKVGQQVSGSFSVTSVGNDQQINFWVTDPKGIRIIDYGMVSDGVEFNFTADEEGDYGLQFFNVPSSFPFSDKTVTLTYDVTAPEPSGPDYFVYSVIGVIILALALTFIFIAYDRKKLKGSTRQTTRRPMIRAVRG